MKNKGDRAAAKHASYGAAGQLLKPPVKPTLRETSSDFSCCGFEALNDEFGWRFLAFLCSAQHVTKGFMACVMWAPRLFVFKEYRLDAAQAALYSGVIALPWAIKPAVGVLSDIMPIMGYAKCPYMLAAVLCGVVSQCVLGYYRNTLAITSVVQLLFLGVLSVSVVDLLSEAAYATRLKEKPAQGPLLLSFIWGGLNIGGLFAIVISGFMLVKTSPWVLYYVGALCGVCTLAPVAFNWIGERRLTAEEVAMLRKRLCAQSEVLWLALILLATCSLLCFSGIYLGTEANALISACALVVVLASFSLMLSPVIAKVNAFSLIQGSLNFRLSSATFYFMTDGPDEYPDGPHFSILFYALTMPMVSTLCSIIGIWVYGRKANSMTYVQMYIVGNVLGALAAVPDLILYLRLNKYLGIDDHIFVLGTTSLETVIAQWLWMPGVVLLSQLCPKGMEATMYAILAGCSNLGTTLSTNFGAYLLKACSIRPDGSPNEGHQFDNLWLLALLGILSPLLPVVLVPWFIPNKFNTEPILEDENAPVSEGSLLRRWFGEHNGCQDGVIDRAA